ncbi:hypothetical protein YC2023_050018 [Brassica napus]
MKPHGKSTVSFDYDKKVLFLKDLSLGPHEAQLRFRLIHFWDAWNPLKKTLSALNGEDPSVLLNALKIQYDETGAKFFEYMAALEAKYQSCISICTPRERSTRVLAE